jgi:hypothetical protein
MHLVQEHFQQCSIRDPEKIFLTFKFSNLLFPTLAIKLKLGLQIGGKIRIATHLDHSNYLANQQRVLGFAVPFTSLSKLCKMLGQNHFVEPNWPVLAFLHRILICRSHTEHHWSCSNAPHLIQ